MNNLIYTIGDNLNKLGRAISDQLFGPTPEPVKTVFFLPDTKVTIDVETASRDDIIELMKFYEKFKHAQHIQNRTYSDSTAGEYRETLKNKEDFNAINELFRIHYPHYCI